jgi:hypothetical protein
MASRHLDNQRAHRRSACPYWAGRVLLRDDHSITLSAGEQAERTILKLPTPFLEAKAISSGKARVGSWPPDLATSVRTLPSTFKCRCLC